MLNRRFVDIYGYVAIVLMLGMLALVAGKLVPVRMYMPLFYATAALFVIRVVLRMVLARQNAARTREKEEPED
ncbi:MAG TPA: hypothetical protein VMM80_12830 [Bacteroidota bacterium]|nr:hypothetical protein [Bacteroidota bacterium]